MQHAGMVPQSVQVYCNLNCAAGGGVSHTAAQNVTRTWQTAVVTETVLDSACIVPAMEGYVRSFGAREPKLRTPTYSETCTRWLSTDSLCIGCLGEVWEEKKPRSLGHKQQGCWAKGQVRATY